jgi:hypothetical protein
MEKGRGSTNVFDKIRFIKIGKVNHNFFPLLSHTQGQATSLAPKTPHDIPTPDHCPI